MLTYQRSSFWSRQSCSQSVDGDQGAFEPLHFAAYEQLWLTYNALQPTAAGPGVLDVDMELDCQACIGKSGSAAVAELSR
jgi:hypothetical protein